jgi:hypothetical protein
MTFDLALTLITDELVRAREKWPAGFHSGHEGYAVILEELDELWDAVRLDATDAAGMEAVQVAAMALRFLLELCDDESVVAGMQGRARATR